jgi:hypothetical protein
MQRSKTFCKYRSFPDKMFAERSHDNVSGGPVRIAITVAQLYLVHMLQRTLPAGSRRASLPKPTSCLPAANGCMRSSMTASASLPARPARRWRLYSRPGNDLTRRFPLIVEALARLRSRSCIIDGEAVACDDNGVASFDPTRHHRANESIFLYAFDLIELNGDDLRRDPLGVRKATLASIVAKASPSIRFNEHIEGDGPTVFAMPASSASKASCRNARIPSTAPAARPTGSK